MGARGERVIETEAGEITILFTNQALAEAEQRMNKGILGILFNSQIGIGDVAHLLRAGMQAAYHDQGRRKEAVSLHDAYKIMDEVGFSEVFTAVTEAVKAVLNYQREQEENGEPDPNP